VGAERVEGAVALSDVAATEPTLGDAGVRYLLVVCYAVGGLVSAAVLALLVLLAVDGHPLALLAAAGGAVLPFPLRGIAYLLGVPRAGRGRRRIIRLRVELHRDSPREDRLVTARHPTPGPSARPGVTILPRFDRAALRMASTLSLRRQAEESIIQDLGLRCVLRDAGHDQLEIIVESSSRTANNAVLAITVVTPDNGQERSREYLMIFKPDRPDMWVAALNVPGVHEWAEVSVSSPRPSSSLGPEDAGVVGRSVRVALDPWVPVWLAVAREREVGDPVRVAIEGAL
jgi:hypothetical protein